MKRLGWAIDWDREVAAHDPDFYRWTQWLFIRFFERGLAYRKAAPVNWCPNDQTVIANEYVFDGRCDRCGALVELRNLEQWFFKITAYADELLEFDLPPGGEWPERTKTIQRNWIGRSEGAEIVFRVEELDTDIPVFTTRADTLFGATFFVLAPEHPLVERIGTRRGARVRAPHRREEDRGARRRRGEDRRLHRPLRDQPGQRRADADLGRRLRADGLRHRRDHGRARARRARPRVRRGLRPADRRGRHRRRCARQLRPVRRAQGRRGQVGDRRVAARARAGQAGGLLPPARLELLAAALLGLPDPDRLLRRLRRRPRPRRPAAGAAPRGRGLPAEGRAAARLQPGVAARALPQVRQAGDARGRHDGHVRRLVLVLPALRRPAQRGGAVRPSAGRLLVPDHDVHRRDRPRHRPPALLALLRQGDERHGHARLPRAVRAPLPPGLGADGRLEDVEVEGEHRRAGRAGRRARGRRDAPLHPVHGPADQDMEWTESGIEGIGRFVRRLWRVVHEVAASAPAGEPGEAGSVAGKAGAPGRKTGSPPATRRGRSSARHTRRSRG